jgi:hypothetical protein
MAVHKSHEMSFLALYNTVVKLCSSQWSSLQLSWTKALSYLRDSPRDLVIYVPHPIPMHNRVPNRM